MLCVRFLHRALDPVNAGKGEGKVDHDSIAQFLEIERRFGQKLVQRFTE